MANECFCGFEGKLYIREREKEGWKKCRGERGDKWRACFTMYILNHLFIQFLGSFLDMISNKSAFEKNDGLVPSCYLQGSLVYCLTLLEVFKSHQSSFCQSQ